MSDDGMLGCIQIMSQDINDILHCRSCGSRFPDEPNFYPVKGGMRVNCTYCFKADGE